MKKGVGIILLPLILALMTVYVVCKIVGAASNAVAKVVADILDAFCESLGGTDKK